MTATATAVAAWVDGAPITVAEVDARLAELRATAPGTRLPLDGTPEGRNARRWVVQLLCAEGLVRRELAALAVAPATRPAALRIDRALALGGVAAAVLATVPEATALIDARRTEVSDEAALAYYERNADLYADRRIPFAQVRTEILCMLGSAAADRAFAAWLERRLATAVVLAPGFEHPADPSHADATHRH